MKAFAIAGLLALSLTASAQTGQTTSFTLSVENENATVSPGGILRLKIQGNSASDSNSKTMSFFFDFSGDVVDGDTPSVYYHTSEKKSHPRFVKAKIKKDIADALPKTITIQMKSSYSRNAPATSTATFYIKEGTHGHPHAGVKAGDYHVTIHPKPDVSSWYEIFCISSLTGHCSINIKNGEYDNKYHGQTSIFVRNHDCNDRGYPGTSRLDIREPLVFDASKLIVEIENFTPPAHHEAEDVGACLFTSDNPFFLRQVEPAPQKPTPAP